MSKILRIFRYSFPVKVLGPGKRAVIWVQGCPFACPGCIVPESWSTQGGEEMTVTSLVKWILAQDEIEGITLSGGEPFQQSIALISLIEQVREVKDLGVMCFTGYKLEYLQERGSAAQKQLLGLIDLLVDGTYIEEQHGDLLWRGSHNQRLLPLTKRYKNLIEEIANSPDQDHSAGLELGVENETEVYFTGVPNQPGFRGKFELQLRERGIILQTSSSQ